MTKSFSIQATTTGLMAAFVGFAGSFAITSNGLVQMGASKEEVATGLMALSVTMGVCAIFLSYKSRMPISVAWSTPGAAFLATLPAAPAGGFPEAVGAFIVSSVLIIIAGLWKPLGKAVTSIPLPIANAMLAGVLLPLCLAPFEAVAAYPAIAIPIVLTWIVVGYFRKLLAIPCAILVGGVLIWYFFPFDADKIIFAFPSFQPILPVFSFQTIIGITIPLFIITMASQNITGLAVLKSFGFEPNAGWTIRTTGVFSLISALWGGHAVNLAAITAAMCAGEDAHPQPDRRYWSAIVAGFVYVIFGFSASLIVAFIASSPPILIAAIAGLALTGALAGAIGSALEDKNHRETAIVTFLITASGVTFFGISGAFWGLVVGGTMHFASTKLLKT